tara:strand:+ start:7796 stop:8245 length:450 start_codon:yes stop_codon:yes gene_type:complete
MVSRHNSAGAGSSLNIAYAKKDASIVLEPNELLTLNATGELIPAVTASLFVVGANLTSIIATDDNYATTDPIQYDKALSGDEFIMAVNDANTAGFVAGVKRGIVDSKTIKAAAAGTDEGLLVRVISVDTVNDLAVVELITSLDAGTVTS